MKELTNREYFYVIQNMSKKGKHSFGPLIKRTEKTKNALLVWRSKEEAEKFLISMKIKNKDDYQVIREDLDLIEKLSDHYKKYKISIVIKYMDLKS